MFKLYDFQRYQGCKCCSNFIEAKVLLKVTVLVMKIFDKFAGQPMSGHVKFMVV